MAGLSRFVYSPKVWAYVKRGTGNNEVVDLTGYLVSGSVTRSLDAVSSAQLTIRNPHRMWTDFKGNRATPAFRPMDPITIYMMRQLGRPVQVFTGYLDRAPYYQLYPGTVTLYASCTLKRLQYTYFDAGLPYMYQFLGQYGWLPNAATGTIVNVNAEMKKINDTSNKTVTDSGIGKLLYGTLEQIGKWGKDDVYIEALPPGVVESLTTIFQTFQDSNQQSINDYKSLLEQYIGVGGEGAAGGSGTNDNGGGTGASAGNPTGAQKCVPVIVKEANAANIPAEMAVATCYLESGFSPTADQGQHIGYYQWDKAGPFPPGSYQGAGLSGHYTLADAQDIGRAAHAFCQAAALWAKKDPSLKGDPCLWALTVQGANSGSNIPYYRGNWNSGKNAIGNAKRWINTFAKASSSSGPRDSGVANNPGTTSAGVSPSGGSESQVAAMIREADRITSKNYPYVWGGGHSNFSGPYDCSGAVSAVMHAAGLLASPLDSGSMMNEWEAGPGRVTIYCRSDHAFMSIDGRFFGTSDGHNGNPNQSHNGAGWLPTPTKTYLDGFTKRHPKGLGGDPKIGAAGSNPKSKFSLQLNPIRYVTTVGTAGKRTEKPRLIIIHDTEGDNAPGTGDLKGVADFLKGEGLSIHIVNDADGNDLRMVEDMVIAQHVVHWNSIALGIEQIGFASQSDWPDAQIENTAKWVAYWADKYDIPLRISTTHGVHSHKGMPYNDHQDPGPNYPMDKMLSKAKEYLGQIGTGADTSTGTGDQGSQVGAAAFAAQVVLPGVEDIATSLLLQGQKSLMNDKPLLPFIQQLTGASLRRFQSLPNGQFFAFYPDYFGEFGNKLPYWEIDDVEILDGTIELTDDNVVTHEYVVGETIPLSGGIGLPEMLQSSGVVTVFNAFGNGDAPGFIKSANQPDSSSAKSTTKSKDEGTGSGNKSAIDFLQRYGARPDLNEAPMIRSPYFELLLAWQRFMQAWSQQFLTEFTFTFMPELYPGGKVGFKNHGIQCFIESVTHNFDMESGFTTTAELSSASAYGADQPALQASLVSNPF